VIEIKLIAQHHLRRERRLPFLQESCIGDASSRIQEPRISGTESIMQHRHGCNGAILVQRDCGSNEYLTFGLGREAYEIDIPKAQYITGLAPSVTGC
jgi:hypothetical protein